MLTEIFDIFDSWDEELNRIVNGNVGYQEILDSCRMVLPEPAALMDGDFKYIAYSKDVYKRQVEDGIAFTKTIGYPVVLRPAYTLGGSGGGIAYDEAQLVEILENGLRLSRVGEVLVERCIAGWKEIEYEVMRDGAGNCITVCNMENIDPVGVHTGDSIVVAPSQTCLLYTSRCV